MNIWKTETATPPNGTGVELFDRINRICNSNRGEGGLQSDIAG
jgi:hypothetical protein